MVVAKRKAINAVRRERLHRSFARDMDALLKSEWTTAYTMDQVFLEDEIKDSQLRMIFTCCHPALPMAGQLALTLKTLCGFNIAEIAAAMLTTESNINKRLYRIKEKIRNEEIPFTVPAGHQLLPRVDAVIRQDLCLEAMRLAMLLTEKPVTSSYHPVYALLALMCFHSARLDARIDTNNSLIVLEEQDRSRWNRELISQGLQFLSRSSGGDQVTAYHLEAAIAAEYCLAPDFPSTNWTRIHNYYTELEKLKPSSVIRLNLAIVTGKTDGPHAALRLLHNLEQNRALDNYYLLDASLGEFYQELGLNEEARAYFRRAQEQTRSPAIREVLEKKIGRL